MKTYTMQEAFDKAVSGVIAQGCQSVNPTDNTACMYRGKNGAKCALGHLLEDSQIGGYGEHSDTVLIHEGQNVSAGRYGPLATLISDVSASSPPNYQTLVGHSVIDFLCGLQRCHDAYSATLDGGFIPNFIRNCRKFAEAYGLNTKVLEESNV